MARIVPKLNLNKTPQIVENYSLVYAKNIKITKDGSIVKDDGISEVTAISDILNIHDVSVVDEHGEIQIKSVSNTLVGYIPYNTSIYLFVYDTDNNVSSIYKYNEYTDSCTLLDTAWHYEGAVTNDDEIECTTSIFGEVIVNLNGDIVLIVSETGNDELSIPIKFINVNRTSSNDDESIYTQSPKTPIINLIFDKKYTKTIPNGVYQFFVRYEIKKNYYTNWMPCSKEIYSGTQITSDSIQGTVKYVDVNSDSSESFIFIVENLTKKSYGYKSFQIGFILSHDDSTVARSWKHFSFDVDKIYFDYDNNYIEEVNIDDMLESIYQIYNPKNITNFKNKVYISNYKESNINPDFSQIAKQINITLNERILDITPRYYYRNKLISTITLSDSSLGYVDFLDENNQLEGNDLETLLKEKLVMANPLTDATTIIDGNDSNNPYGYNSTIAPYHTITTDTPGVYYESSGFQRRPTEVAEKLLEESCKYGLIIKYAKVKLKGIDTLIDLINEEIKIPRDTYFNHLDTYGSEAQIINILSNSNLQYVAFDSKGFIHIRQQGSETIQEIEYLEYKIIYSIRRDGWEDIAVPNVYININGHQQLITARGYRIPYHLETKRFTKFVVTNLLSRKSIQFEYSSLIPFKSYAFYVHYVKDTGECTNGYFIKEVLCKTDSLNANGKLIYPSFSNIQYPEGYPYCFISIVDVNNNVAQVFNDNCLDIDALLLPINKNIRLYSLAKLNTYVANNTVNGVLPTRYDVTEIEPDVYADYKYSGKLDVNYKNYFGASGRLIKSNDGTDTSITALDNLGNNYFVVQPNTKNEDNIALTKCTPYINTNSYDNFNDLNLLGYVCSVYKPNVDDLSHYISGSDVYSKDYNTTQAMSLTLITNSSSIVPHSTSNVIVYSEYNLNYLSLNQELSTRIFGTTTETSSSGSTSNTKALLTSFESLILSDIYTLKSMYKDYRKKLFFPIESDTITEFNNTIRASEVHSDEGITYLLKFNADQYYNVPTNKGYIVNLKAIADKILVHTQDSLYSFSGSSKISTQDGNAQLTESDPFDTGITELFGSEHGFVGLADKHNTMISYDGYFFFDKDAKTVYDYTGQGIILLSDPIERLMNYEDIVNVTFANDYYNDRFFMQINFINYKSIVLSFNYKQKTFVSLHDFSFDESISTKTNCYFIYNNRFYKVDKNVAQYHTNITKTDNFLPHHLDEKTSDEGDYQSSIVDVIFNDSFEAIKVLNSISWIGSTIQNDFKNENYIIATEPAIYTDYSVDQLRIYTDSCCTELLDVSQKDYHNTNKSDYPNKERLNDYKLPSFNNGIWSFNYLRNVYNKNNPFSTEVTRNMTSDVRSLIYGKYFVVRFIFDSDRNFKLENVMFNYGIQK